MASVRKRGAYQWEARIRRKGWPPQFKTFETRADAEAWAREIESEMDRGVFRSRAEAERTTLSEALDRYILEYVPRLSDPKRQADRIRYIQKRDICRMYLAAIRGKDIADFMRGREAEGCQANTIRLDLALFSRLFEVARRDWGMEGLLNPVRNVTKPKVPGGRTRRLKPGEEERLLAAASPAMQQAIKFALETAMRREEIGSLTWDRVNLSRRLAHLPRTKNGEARSVPLSPAALELLRALPRNISGSVFGLKLSSITQGMVKACAAAGIEDLRFHDLRHEAISRFFERTDLDMMEIKLISGHKTLQMLARYTHLRASRLAERLAGASRNKSR